LESTMNDNQALIDLCSVGKFDLVTTTDDVTSVLTAKTPHLKGWSKTQASELDPKIIDSKLKTIDLQLSNKRMAVIPSSNNKDKKQRKSLTLPPGGWDAIRAPSIGGRSTSVGGGASSAPCGANTGGRGGNPPDDDDDDDDDDDQPMKKRETEFDSDSSDDDDKLQKEKKTKQQQHGDSSMPIELDDMDVDEPTRDHGGSSSSSSSSSNTNYVDMMDAASDDDDDDVNEPPKIITPRSIQPVKKNKKRKKGVEVPNSVKIAAAATHFKVDPKRTQAEAHTLLEKLKEFVTIVLPPAQFLLSFGRWEFKTDISSMNEMVKSIFLPYKKKNFSKVGEFWAHFVNEIKGFLVDIGPNVKSFLAPGKGEKNSTSAALVCLLHCFTVLGDLTIKCSKHLINKGEPLSSDKKAAPTNLTKYSEEYFLQEMFGHYNISTDHSSVMLEDEGCFRTMSIIITKAIFQQRLFRDSRGIYNAPNKGNCVLVNFSDWELNSLFGFTFGAHALNQLISNVFDSCRTIFNPPNPIGLVCKPCDVKGKEEESKRKSRINATAVTVLNESAKFFGPSLTDAFSHERCTFCTRGGLVMNCDGCACDVHFNKDTGASECCQGFAVTSDGRSVTKPGAPGHDFWLCPVCNTSKTLHEAVTTNLGNHIPYLLMSVASHTFKHGQHSTTALHTAAIQNNYSVLSQLLYGAFLLNEMSEQYFPSFPHVLSPLTWSKDAHGRTAFDAAYETSVRGPGGVCTEALFLLSAR
jgi:hypothetical protein